MSRYIETRVGQSGTVLIEISDDLAEPVTGGEVVKATPLEDVAERAHLAFNRTLDLTRILAEAFIEKLRELKDSPNEVELSFGVKVDAGASALVAKTSTEAQFGVKIKWKRTAAS